MQELPSGSSNPRTAAVSRRRLLAIAGGLGVGAFVGACAKDRGVEVVSASRSSDTTSPPVQVATDPAGLTTTPPVEPVPPPPSASVQMLCRESWGARPPRADGQPHTITQMTLHHTAAVLGDNSNAPVRLRQHQQFHQNDRGWIDIAYHVGVDRNGNIYELRDWNLAGDTATDYEPAGHFLVLCEGDFDQEPVSEAQLDSAARVFAWAAGEFQIGSETLSGHGDHAATACPGTNLNAYLESDELKRRVDAYLQDGPVGLERVCGPEADAIVAEVAAGRR